MSDIDKDVVRYVATDLDPTMVPDPTGAWVRVEDYQAKADRIKELEANLARAADSEVIKAQQLFNYYAVEVVTYGATASRLTNLENAWINLLNLQIQIELEELKGESDE